MTNIWMQLPHMLRLLCYLSSEDVLVIKSYTAQVSHKYYKFHPLPEKIGLGSADFLHSGTGYIEIAMFVLWLIFVDFGQNFSERALLVLKNQSRFQ